MPLGRRASPACLRSQVPSQVPPCLPVALCPLGPNRNQKEQIELTGQHNYSKEVRALILSHRAIFFSTDLSSELSKVSKPRAAKPGRKKGGRARKGPKRPQLPNPPPAPLAPGLLDQGGPLPAPMPKKRGRKSKAELLLLKLSKGLEQPESPPPKRPPEDFETPPGERPRRRVAQV